MKKKICFVVSAPITAKAFLIKHFEYLSKEFDITLVANFETQSDFEIPFVKNTKSIAIHRSINPLKDFLALIRLYFFFKRKCNKSEKTNEKINNIIKVIIGNKKQRE